MAGNGNGNGNGQLTGLQRAFIDEWFKDFNGVKAAKRAGYQGDYSTLGSVASENLKKPKIQAEIERRWSAHGVTSEEVLATLTKQMRANPGDFMDEFGRVDLKAVKENGRGIVVDASESYVWYSIALDNAVDDDEAKKNIQERRERVKMGLISVYPAPSDHELEGYVEAQKNRITEYLAEIKNMKR